MATAETLRAVLEADQDISASMEMIVQSVRRAAEQMGDASSTSTRLASSLDISESQADRLAESLRSLPDDAVAASQSVSQLRRRIDELGDEDAQVSVQTSALEEAIQSISDDAVAASSTVSALQSRIEQMGDESTQSAVSASLLSNQIGSMGTESVSTAAMLTLLANRIDEVGDESMQASAQVGGLSSAFAGLETGATFAGVRLSLSALVTVMIGAIAVIGSLTAALSGLAIAALGAGGALAAIFGGGLLFAAEQMAARSSEVEGTMEGLQEIASRLNDALSEAIEPLKQPEFANAAISALESLVNLVNALAESIAAISDPLLRAAGAIADAFREQSTRILAELEQTIVALLPLIKGLASWLAQSLPGALAFFREQAQILLPVLGDFGSSLLSLVAQMSALASTVLSVVLPVLTPVLDTLSFALSLFNRLPRPLKQFVAALTGLFILQQLAALQATLNAIHAAGAAIMSSYTAAVSAFQFASFLATVATWALNSALLTLGAPIWLVVGAIGAVVGALLALADYLGIIPDLGDMFGDFIDWVGKKLDVLPDDGDDLGGGNGSGTSPPSKPVRDRMKRNEKHETNYDIDVDARNSGMSESQISKIVQDAVEEARREEHQRSSGRGG